MITFLGLTSFRSVDCLHIRVVVELWCNHTHDATLIWDGMGCAGNFQWRRSHIAQPIQSHRVCECTISLAWVGRRLYRICVSVRPRSERKTAWAINAKLGWLTMDCSHSACIDLEAKRSMSAECGADDTWAARCRHCHISHVWHIDISVVRVMFVCRRQRAALPIYQLYSDLWTAWPPLLLDACGLAIALYT